jgi:hypothetical protein
MYWLILIDNQIDSQKIFHNQLLTDFQYQSITWYRFYWSSILSIGNAGCTFYDNESYKFWKQFLLKLPAVFFFFFFALTVFFGGILDKSLTTDQTIDLS